NFFRAKIARTFILRHGSAELISTLSVEFLNLLSDYHYSVICEYLQYGFPIGYFGNSQQQSYSDVIRVKNHKGAKDFPRNVQEFLDKEKTYGAILGPFNYNPFACNVTISPLNTVPKKGSDERRIILDLSYPKGSSINDNVSKDFYLGEKVELSYPGVDQLVEIIKLKGRNCLLFKRDLKRAYRQIPIDPGDSSLLGYCFNGKLYFDKVLSFGLRSSAFICQRITSSITYICKILQILIVNYLDDLAGADTPEKAWASFSELGKVFLYCGLEESVEKACSPSTEMVFIGVLFDTETMTLKVTSERLVEIRSMVFEWLKKDTATLKELQSLLGKLNFVAHCVKPARIFICRLLNWLRRIQNKSNAQPIPLEAKKDLEWWSHFLPIYNGISMMDVEDWSSPDEVLSCDACLTGCGAWFEGNFFHCEFPSFIMNQNLHINALELLTIVVAVKIWGSALKGKKVVVNCDNSTSCRVLNTGFSRDCFLQSCLREICYFAAINEFQIKASLLSSSENRLADNLSRWTIKSRYSELFHEFVAGMTVTEHIVHESFFNFYHDW
ncbi:MAG: reverse transcriptase domain-containing protein, partial [Candidatus Thiodiazotropha sp.]